MITSSTLWIVLVVALGLPSAVVGFLVRRMEKKIDKNEKTREEKDDLRVKHEIMMIDLSMASLTLAEATAEAVQRIPDSNCNGDMTAALNKAREIQGKYREFEREQTAKAVRL